MGNNNSTIKTIPIPITIHDIKIKKEEKKIYPDVSTNLLEQLKVNNEIYLQQTKEKEQEIILLKSIISTQIQSKIVQIVQNDIIEFSKNGKIETIYELTESKNNIFGITNNDMEVRYEFTIIYDDVIDTRIILTEEDIKTKIPKLIIDHFTNQKLNVEYNDNKIKIKWN